MRFEIPYENLPTVQCEKEVDVYIEMFLAGEPTPKTFLPENLERVAEFSRLLKNLKTALSEYNSFIRTFN